MTEYRLYCFAQSGNAYKIALMLNLCGLDWEPVHVRFFEGETFTPAYRAINEMGEVPVLEVDGQRLSQSGVILDYLVSVTGRFGWTNEEERREILRWLLFDNHKVSNNAATYRVIAHFLEAGDTPVAKHLRWRLNAALSVLDARLNDLPFIIGRHATIADLSLCGYLFWNEEFGETWGSYPNIPPWLDRIRALPGWTHPYELMPGHPLTVNKDDLKSRFQPIWG